MSTSNLGINQPSPSLACEPQRQGSDGAQLPCYYQALNRWPSFISCGWACAGAQPWQDPGGTLGMNGVGERKHVKPAFIGPSVRGREKERERESDWTRGAAESGNAFFFLP